MPNINSYKGVGTAGLIAVVLGMLAAGVGTAVLTNFLQESVQNPPAISPVIEPQQFRVTFTSEDGTEIEVLGDLKEEAPK